MKKVLLGILAVLTITSLMACGEKTKEQDVIVDNSIPSNEVVEREEIDVPKNEQTGTAGSNIPLQDNEEEAKKQIEIALRTYLEDAYNGKLEEIRINNIKVYSYEERQEIEPIKDLDANSVAFSVEYDVLPTSGENKMEYTAATGEESGDWVVNKSNIGILSLNEENEYEITSFGTGF